MKRTRSVAAVLVVCGAVASCLVSACSLQRVRTPQPGEADLVMLLPDPERNTTGRAVTSANGASAELDAAGEYTLVGVNQPPTRVKMMKESEVKRLYGDLLASLPPPPRHFTLYFRFESDELTDESRALVPDMVQAMKDRPVPEVAVVGHTDTTGTPANNHELGLKRGNMVRGLLVAAGLDAMAVEVTSHGEAVLLVRTPDETYEPRNRRVEITIR
jgi:outer membrane protein OmpA-like peptidoglycan-associated protein